MSNYMGQQIEQEILEKGYMFIVNKVEGDDVENPIEVTVFTHPWTPTKNVVTGGGAYYDDVIQEVYDYMVSINWEIAQPEAIAA